MSLQCMYMYIDFKVNTYRMPVNNDSELQAKIIQNMRFIFIQVCIRRNIFFSDKRELQKLNHQSSV